MRKNLTQVPVRTPVPTFLSSLLKRAFGGLAKRAEKLANLRTPGRIAGRQVYALEAMEPRLLLSAVAIDLTAGNDALVLNQTGVDAVAISVDGGGAFTDYLDVDSIVINGLGGDDTFTLNFDSGLGALAADISLFGGSGYDTLLLNGNLNLGGKTLIAEADAITANGEVGGAASVNLHAISDDSASLVVNNSISASGAVVLSAQAGKSTSLGSFTTYTGTSSAAVNVQGPSTVISGATVAITVRNTVQIDASVNGSLLGGFDIAQTNTTEATVSGGAAIVATSTDVLVEAVDDSQIDVDVFSTAASSFDFSVLFSNAALTRTTAAEVTGVGTGVASAGLVTIEARNTGGISASADSGLVGSAINEASDTATARVVDVTVGTGGAPVGGLAVRAVNSGSYNAVGKIAINSISGGTTAAVENSDVFSTGLSGITVVAADSATVTTESTPVSIDLASLTSSASVGMALSRNVVNRATEAHVVGANLVSDGGDIEVAASSYRTVSAVSLFQFRYEPGAD